MRKRNWQEYNKELVQRGSLTFLIDPKLLKPSRKAVKKNGRPQEFADPFIMMLMMVKIHLRLPYRALQGFIQYIFNLQNCSAKVPNYSLICRRAVSLKGTLPFLSHSRPSVILLDASGVKVVGEGEWKVKIHGRQRRRKWVKVHIAVDADTQEIVAQITTPSSVKDGKMTEALLQDVKGRLRAVVADGAYDDKQSREVVRRKKAKALIPPPRNARIWGIDRERDDAVRVIRGLGGDREAKSLWGKLMGYSIRALVETAFSRMKRLFGERLFSKDSEKQKVENGLRCLILNKLRRKEHITAASALG